MNCTIIIFTTAPLNLKNVCNKSAVKKMQKDSIPGSPYLKAVTQKVYPTVNVSGILTPAFSVKILPFE
jgi:hypothetical protein